MPRELCIGVAFAFSLFTACGSAPAVIPAGEAPAPAGLRVEVWAPEPAELLASVASALEGTSLAQRIPTDVPSVLSAMLEGSDAVVRLAAPDSPLGLVIVGSRERTAWIVRLRTLTDPDRARLQLAPSGVPWARVVTVRDRSSRAVAAIANDWLVVADDRGTLDATLPYLARTLARRRARAASPSLFFRFTDGAAADALRPALDRRWRAWVRDAREAARNERARHRLPPTIGEPEVLIDEVDRAIGRRLSWLRDLGRGEGSLRIEDGAVLVEATADVRGPSSPLARTLGGEPSAGAAAQGIGALPATTAFGWSGSAGAAARRETTEDWLAAAARTSGSRLAEGELDRWRAALRAFDDAVGDDRAVALGVDANGRRTVAIAFETRDEAAATTACSGLAGVLAAGHLAEASSALAGCVPLPTPETTRAPGSGPSIARPAGDGGRIVCAPDPTRRDAHAGALGWSLRGRLGGLAWAHDVEAAIALAASARESWSTPSGASIAGDDPDASRWLDAQRDAFFALAVSPSGIVRIARARAGSPPRDRALVAFARTPRGIRTRARIPIRAALATVAIARMLGSE
ncbi:MAG: hypothetical protein IT379_42640 [Deltaproteobacteria bacterium]|nr:hypothetical protein [Deltaproteobacteria bacterium]